MKTRSVEILRELRHRLSHCERYLEQPVDALRVLGVGSNAKFSDAEELAYRAAVREEIEFLRVLLDPKPAPPSPEFHAVQIALPGRDLQTGELRR